MASSNIKQSSQQPRADQKEYKPKVKKTETTGTLVDSQPNAKPAEREL
jgi:hypothetical protein